MSDISAAFAPAAAASAQAQSEAAASAAPARQGQAQATVLHLVGRITDTVFSFLGPATMALAEQGVGQTVVLMDDPRYRHLLQRFDPSVQLVLVDSGSPFRQRHAALLQAYCQTARRTQPTAAHLHGVLCLMLGTYASRVQKLAVPTFFTPHGSRTLAPLRWIWQFLGWLMQQPAGRLSDRVIASSGSEARELQATTSHAVHLVESPVSAAFFDEVHLPGPLPCVITGHRGSNELGCEQFAQCAVLLVDQMPDLCFGWIGTADSTATERLKAAGIALADISDDRMRARRMAAAWVFLAPEGAPGFPVFLAEAMALGLPCVGWDTPQHRDLIEHGVTGLLCNSTDEAIEQLAELLESAPLRQRIGDAARSQARLRFGNERFRAALLGVYGMPVAP